MWAKLTAVWSAISFKSSKSACTFTNCACTFTIVRALFVKVNCKSARTFELLKLMARYISAVSFKSPKSVCTFTIVRALYQISVLRFPKYSTNVTTIQINGKFPWSIIFNIEYFQNENIKSCSLNVGHFTGVF